MFVCTSDVEQCIVGFLVKTSSAKQMSALLVVKFSICMVRFMEVSMHETFVFLPLPFRMCWSELIGHFETEILEKVCFGARKVRCMSV